MKITTKIWLLMLLIVIPLVIAADFSPFIQGEAIPSDPYVNESFTLYVNATDDVGLDYIKAKINDTWFIYSCNSSTYCENNWSVVQDTAGLYNYFIKAYDTSNNAFIDFVQVNITNPPPDLTPPGNITGLNATLISYAWIFWNWTNPLDSDFSYVQVWLDNINVQNTSNDYYNATSLAENSTHTIGVLSVDTNGNVNTTWVNDTQITAVSVDTTPPVISNVQNTSITNESALITWDTDENATSLVKYGTSNGSYASNESDGTLVISHSMNLTGLQPDTTYYYVVNSTDAAGNSAESAEYSFLTFPNVVDGPPTINYIADFPDPVMQGNEITFEANVTDDFSVDTVLVEIDGTNYTMNNISDDIWQYVLNTSSLAPGLYNYTIYANDSIGWQDLPESGQFNVANPFNNPPQIIYTDPANYTGLIENNTQIFTINATDADGDNLTVRWFVNELLKETDNITEGDGQVNFSYYFSELGIQNVTVNVSDSQNYTTYGWVVNVTEAPDLTPPGSVTNLNEFEVTNVSIAWNWTNPSDPDFDHVEIWVNGPFQVNISQPSNSVNITLLTPETLYEIQTRTVDTNDNINTTWVNDTAVTLPNADEQAPYYSNIIEPSDPSTYSPGASYTFNITWQDNVAVDSVVFEFDGTNYTDATQNGNVWSKILNDLAAGTYNYVWYANDTSGNDNQTGILSFTVDKAITTVNLYLTGTEDNLTVTYPTQTNATATTSALTVTLYRGGVNVTNPEIANLSYGTYNYTAINPGNENYSSSQKTFFLTVNKASSSCSLSFNPVSPIPYGTAVNVSCSCTNPEGSAQLYRNGTNVTSEIDQNVVLAAGSYNYVCNVSETANYQSASNSSGLVVEKANSAVNLTLDGIDDNITRERKSTVNITGERVTGEGNIELYGNGTLINSGGIILTNLTTYNSVAVYNITVVYPETGNYSSSYETHFITVEDTTAPGTVSNLNETSKTNDSIYWEWTNPADDDFNHVEIWIDGTPEANVSVEYYNYTNLTANTTYEIQTITVDDYDNKNTTWVNDSATTDANPVQNITDVQINITSPDNTTFYLNDTVDINVTTNTTVAYCNYEIVGEGLNGSLSSVNNLTWTGQVNVSGLDDDYNLTVECDSNTEYLYPFNVDTVDPNGTSIYPEAEVAGCSPTGEITGVVNLTYNRTTPDVQTVRWYWYNGSDYIFIAAESTPVGDTFMYEWNSSNIESSEGSMRVDLEDDAGRNYSDYLDCLELDNDAPTTITDLVALPGGASTTTVGRVDLYWTAPQESPGVNKSVSSYTIKYTNGTPINESNWGNATNLTGCGAAEKGPGNDAYCSAEGGFLPNGTGTYCFAIKSTDNLGQASEISNSDCSVTGYFDIAVEFINYSFENAVNHTYYLYDTINVWENVTNYGNRDEVNIAVKLWESYNGSDLVDTKYINLSINETKPVNFTWYINKSVNPNIKIESGTTFSTEFGDPNNNQKSKDVRVHSIVDEVNLTWSYNDSNPPGNGTLSNETFRNMVNITNLNTAPEDDLFDIPLTIDMNTSFTINATKLASNCGLNKTCYLSVNDLATYVHYWDVNPLSAGIYNVTVTAGAHAGDQKMIYRLINISNP